MVPCAKHPESGRYASNGKCIACAKEAQARTRAKHKEKRYAATATWYAENHAKTLEYKRAYYEANREKYAEQAKQRYAKEQAEGLVKRAAFRATNKQRIAQQRKAYLPKILAANAERSRRTKGKAPRWERELTRFVAQEAYDLARRREVCVGGKWHVDHDIPLQAKVVSGLHVWNNLAVVPAAQNLSKHNFYEVT